MALCTSSPCIRAASLLLAVAGLVFGAQAAAPRTASPAPMDADRASEPTPPNDPPNAAALPGPTPSAFVEGYASALLHEAHGIRDFGLSLVDRTLIVDLEDEPDSPADKVARSLLAVRGVQAVRIRLGERILADIAREAPRADGEAPVERVDEAAGPGEQQTVDEGYELFPGDELFDMLIADPRWPRFSASHQWYLDDEELDRVGAVSFGETFPLLRSPEADWGRWELAFQAGVFSVFDLEAASLDLVNSDFFVGLSASHHLGDVTTMVRIYHQSSHLGDEFLLRNRVDRVNLSFEVLDALVSWEPWRWLRLYGGGGLLVHREPRIDRGITQVGLELTGPVAHAGGYLRPIAAVDVQHREESDWKTDLSVRAGVQVEHPALRRQRLQVLGEFYTGRSPNGQFFERSIETLGLGVHLTF
ncbi:MAG: DUF1207 domain-containing protein [bacterium]